MPQSFSTELHYENLNSSAAATKKTLSIIHFNDVYNIESRDVEPVGGSARFVTAVEELIKKGPTLVLFSGDAISPSSGKLMADRGESGYYYYWK